MYDSNSMIFWKRQNHRENEKISGLRQERLGKEGKENK